VSNPKKKQAPGPEASPAAANSLTVSPPAESSLPKPTPAVTRRPRILVAHADPALLHLIRESLETFLPCEVRTTTSGLAAFDRVLQETYHVLLLDLHLHDLPGELLYDLISRAYPKVHPGTHTAPPVIWLGLPADHPRQDALTREARTKALLIPPLNIQRLLGMVTALLPRMN